MRRATNIPVRMIRPVTVAALTATMTARPTLSVLVEATGATPPRLAAATGTFTPTKVEFSDDNLNGYLMQSLPLINLTAGHQSFPLL